MLIKKISIFFIAISITGVVHAQDHSITFDHLALSVKDLNRSAAFYKNVLMLQEIPNLSANEGMRWFSLSGGRELHLISVNKEEVVTNKAVHIAFTSNSFDAVLKRVTELKIAFSDWQGTPNKINTRADGIKQIYFQDPDGYWIEVNSVGDAKGTDQSIKDQVWQLEEDYWTYVKNKDLKSYITLWDDQFIGYPSTNKIGGKAHITNWITEMYQGKNTRFHYELTRHVENVFDDIVIVLYDATQIWTNDKNEVVERSTYKITHTWKKTGNGWLIIGGMGAKK